MFNDRMPTKDELKKAWEAAEAAQKAVAKLEDLVGDLARRANRYKPTTLEAVVTGAIDRAFMRSRMADTALGGLEGVGRDLREAHYEIVKAEHEADND